MAARIGRGEKGRRTKGPRNKGQAKILRQNTEIGSSALPSKNLQNELGKGKFAFQKEKKNL